LGYMATSHACLILFAFEKRILEEAQGRASAMTFSLRKEVIQPQVLLRLPCYDFTPIMNHTLDGCLPCGLAHRLLVQSTFVM
jgi:hypothetical protein